LLRREISLPTHGTLIAGHHSQVGKPSIRSNTMGSTFNGLIGLIILALDIWAIINVLKSGAETGKKILWILLIVILPVLGLIIWAIAGPRGNVRI
jgi:hypothetical protein